MTNTIRGLDYDIYSNTTETVCAVPHSIKKSELGVMPDYSL